MTMRFLLVFLSLLVCAAGVPARAAQTPRPNILVAVADDWSFGHAGAYGCRWVKTPHFDRVAREGLLFTRAYTPTAKCSPSRSAILTGRNPWQLGAAANHSPIFPPEFGTYPEGLAKNGYFVGLTSKGWGPGEAKDAAGKPRQMVGTPFNKRTVTPPASGISKNDYAANFADFLQARPPGEPWCFWYGSIEPHRAYEYGSGVAKGGKKLEDIDRVPAYWPDNEVIRNDLLDYALEVEYFDLHLGRMLEALEASGQLDNTLVIVTSDNGMPFPRGKGQEYDVSNHLPLAVRWPAGIKAPGRVVEDYVSLIDLAPSLLAVAGVSAEQAGMAPVTGRSLVGLFQSGKGGLIEPGRDHVLLGRERNDVGRPGDAGYPIRSIVKNGMLLSVNFEPGRWPACNPETGYLDTDGSPTKTWLLESHRRNPADPHWALAFGKRGAEELYDLTSDPDCVQNLADAPERQSAKAALSAELSRALLAEGDLRMLGRGAEYEAHPYSEQRWRGMYERFRSEGFKPGWVDPGDFEKDGAVLPTPLPKE
jgi:N-sulfoglucosamine sulfohydrolase